MARYEQLPIYTKAMELSVYLEGVVANFSRYHNYAFFLAEHSLCCGCIPVDRPLPFPLAVPDVSRPGAFLPFSSGGSGRPVPGGGIL